MYPIPVQQFYLFYHISKSLENFSIAGEIDILASRERVGSVTKCSSRSGTNSWDDYYIANTITLKSTQLQPLTRHKTNLRQGNIKFTLVSLFYAKVERRK